MKRKNKTPIRVAMFGHKRIPSREGGVEVVVQELSTRLAELGCNVTCYNRSGHHVSGKEFDERRIYEYGGVRLRTVPAIPLRGLAAISSSVFASIFSAFGKYDIVHIHAEGPAFMCWLPKLLGKRVVVTVHGLDHKRAKWGRLASSYILAGEKNTVKFADEIIVLSESTRQYFKENYGRNVVCIPNGATRPTYRKVNLIRERFALEQKGYILFLGRIVPEKGIKCLLEAFKDVNTEKKLVIAGGSSNTDHFLKELKSMSFGDDRVVFTGFVQGQLLEELYSNAYVYVLPSDLEGMPLGLLEAMSYGNCCLTSDIPECLEVVGSHGITFPRGSIEALRRKMQELCDEPQTVERYRQGTESYVCRKYSWDETARRTLNLYQGENRNESSAGQ